MKNTLHSFGCSFSEHFIDRLKNSYLDLNVYNSYKQKYGEEHLLSWHDYISSELKLDLNVDSHSGGSNYQIFQSFCDSIHKLKENDIVIIEWSYINRFRIVNNQYNGWTPILSNQSEHDLISTDCLNKLIFLRETKSNYKDEIISYMKLIDAFCELKGIKLFYWTIDNFLFNYFYTKDLINTSWLFFDKTCQDFNYIQYVLGNGGLTIKDEIDIEDPHFGIKGNEIFGKLVVDYIKNLN